MALASLDVTDQTFETEVLDRSRTVPVVLDLWAPWCGPCRQLTPVLEEVIGATNGAVVLAKLDIDENPAVAQALQVQSIPYVWAFKDRRPVSRFVGAQGRREVQAFVAALLPSEEEGELAALVAAGDEASLRTALERDPDHEGAIVALAELLVGRGERDEALDLLARIPETPEIRRVAALARTGGDADGDIEAKLQALLDRVKQDDAARQEFVDLLELLGPDDPRTGAYRRQLTARLY